MQPHEPPLPLNATLSLGTGVLTVQFDRLLQPGLLNSANWTTDGLNAGIRTGAPPTTAAGDTVTSATTAPFPSIGPDVVHYTPPPFDVTSKFAIPAAPFANFALTVLP